MSTSLATTLPGPVGFVFGGGGSLGAMQVGMLQAVSERGVRAGRSPNPRARRCQVSENIFTQPRDTHWYTAEGEPCHSQPDGKKTTLRHARKQNLLPSVTSVLSIIPKQAVEDWRVQQAVIATMQCMSEPDGAMLTAEEMMGKVSERLESNTGTGRRFGSEMHEIVEYINDAFELPPSMSPLGMRHELHAAKYLAWIKSSGLTVQKTELPITGTCPLSYGGCVDLVASREDGTAVVLDIKTQDLKGKSVRVYPEWAYQLAAYRNALLQRNVASKIECVSVVISAEDGEVSEHLWTDEDIADGFNVFCRAYSLWSAVRGYAPAVETEATTSIKAL